MPPIIGVSSGRRMAKSPEGLTRAHVLFTTYTEMIRSAGGLPVILTPGPSTEAEAALDGIDALLLSGGGDVDPSLYGGKDHESIYAVDRGRDEYEIALARGAAARRLPTLAICRGMQVLNVALGGTLIEDLGSEQPDAMQHWTRGRAVTEPQHMVEIEPGSTTAKALETDAVTVNTIHHQGIRVLAPSLRVTGRSSDRVIEAVEPRDDAWPLWGVQWHPEYLGEGHRPSVALFEALVSAAAR